MQQIVGASISHSHHRESYEYRLYQTINHLHIFICIIICCNCINNNSLYIIVLVKYNIAIK
jgi:hypothetical protein